MSSSSAVSRPLRAPELLPGDRVHLCAPSYPVESVAVESAQRVLEQAGFEVLVAPNATQRHGYLAGEDALRAQALQAALEDPGIRAIIGLRGGYGSSRLLRWLDLQALVRSPKILVGYSDFTALLLAAWQQTGLVTFHGPLAAVEFHRPESDQSLKQLLQALAPRPQENFPTGRALRSGHGEGRLVGGCLSLLVHLLGTPFFPDLDGAILFWEEVGEDPYRIDRMLTQLRLAGKLDRLQGMVIGGLTGCVPDPPKPSLTIEELVLEVLAGTNYPVALGFPLGHVPAPWTVPVGILAGLESDGAEARLRFLEGATVPR